MSADTLVLRGAGGEPVDFRRTVLSHGVASLPPMQSGPEGRSLEVTVRLAASRARTVLVRPGGRGRVELVVRGRAPSAAAGAEIRAAVRHILRLDADLSGFYEAVAADPDLSWVGAGAGRMIQSQTVFEDVVKTICTTNCAWSATERMVGALVTHLGERAAGDERDAPWGHAFPTPEAMASAGVDFYREVVRAGYRAAYLAELARAVAGGEVDLESWGRASSDELPDDELAVRLLALPGVGPYAAAHIMMMMGRYSRLILDSWTRPTYARLVGRKTVKDAAIERRFAKLGPYAGLGFWCLLTRGWVEADRAGDGSAGAG